MIPKDWIRSAAQDLAKLYRHGANGRDDYVTDEQRTFVAEGYEKLIRSHCPMELDKLYVPVEPGVAYMPVPRCDRCKHWQQFELENIGKCLEADRAILFSASKCGLETREDFGCIRWEAKP